MRDEHLRQTVTVTGFPRVPTQDCISSVGGCRLILEKDDAGPPDDLISIGEVTVTTGFGAETINFANGTYPLVTDLMWGAGDNIDVEVDGGPEFSWSEQIYESSAIGELQPDIQKTLGEFGFDSFIHTENWFEAARPLPPSLAQ